MACISTGAKSFIIYTSAKEVVLISAFVDFSIIDTLFHYVTNCFFKINVVNTIILLIISVTQHLLHSCLSWERDPSQVALS